MRVASTPFIAIGIALIQKEIAGNKTDCTSAKGEEKLTQLLEICSIKKDQHTSYSFSKDTATKLWLK